MVAAGTALPLHPLHVMSKPTGAICNLACSYCFYLTKEELYPDSPFRMSAEVQERFIRQYLASQPDGEVTLAWQGGEPTMMGLDFFRRAVELAERYRRTGQQIQHTIQTNGTLLDDEWGAFLKQHGWLVGLSIDGPREMHDAYRVDKGGKPTFDRVMQGWDVLVRHDVDANILCTVHTANQDHPLDVYRFFRDDLGARHIQLIPIVERVDEFGRTGAQRGTEVTERSVDPVAWGSFLVDIFDEWVRRDVGSVFVLLFDAALARWLGLPSVCIFNETCGDAVALEHTGDVFACDHFVEPEYLLGNLTATPLLELVNLPQQAAFGEAKRDTLPGYCLECPVRFACHGECPKNRFTTTPDGQPGLNYLCAGYRAFFTHIDRPMRLMADLLRRGRFAGEVMAMLDTSGWPAERSVQPKSTSGGRTR